MYNKCFSTSLSVWCSEMSFIVRSAHLALKFGRIIFGLQFFCLEVTSLTIQQMTQKQLES